MPAAVFVTATPQSFGGNLLVHKDTIAIENEIMTLTVRGQPTGRDDALIEAAMAEDDAIHIFWRRNGNRGFVYYGVADSAKILVERNGERGLAVPTQDRNLFRFETDARRAIQLPHHRQDDQGAGCCKRASMAHIGAPLKVSHIQSFYRW